LSLRIETGAALLSLFIGGWIGTVDQPLIAGYAVAVIVLASVWHLWRLQELDAEARRPCIRVLFLLGLALMLTGW
jgi:hypothetical protein